MSLQWNLDFQKRELMLDWDNVSVGEYEATCVQSARFLEASERFQDMTFVSQITLKIMNIGELIALAVGRN